MWSFLVCCLTIPLWSSAQRPGPTVQTPLGLISGLELADFNAFVGIPYGAVDENKPFSAATPAKSFNATYLAHTDPPVCPQLVNGVPQGSIHCLHLNIYTPKNITTNSSLAVLVYIHGGGFVQHSGNLNFYNPYFFMMKNIIFVTLNYRLGPYGFLCLPNTNYSNQGLLDQSLAFDWLKSYINFFGGNNNDMTLFGHSAGSMCAELQVLFNNKRVFNKAIFQSGLASSPLLLEGLADEDYLKRIAKKVDLNYEHLKTIDILNKLSNVDAMKLVSMTGNDHFNPCVDNVFIQKTATVDLKGMKVIIGSAAREALFFYKNDRVSDQFLNFLPEQSVSKVRDFYFKSNMKNDAIQFGTDYLFDYPIERSIRHYQRNGVEVFRYIFGYDSARNYVKVRDHIDDKGATHGDELGYIFGADFLPDEIAEEDGVIIDAITTWWTNFAKYGKPDSSWPAVSNTRYYKNIASPTTNEKDYFKDKIEFWDEFYSMYGGCINTIDFGEKYKCLKN